MAAADKTIFECPVYTLYTQLDGAHRIIVQASADAVEDKSVPLSLLAQWLFANNQIGIFSGSGNPDNATGKNGDLYFQTNGQLKQKIAGVWVLKASTGTTIAPDSVYIPATSGIPRFIAITDHPTMSVNAELICKIQTSTGFRRVEDFTIDEVYSFGSFTGWNVYGHNDGSNQFAENSYVILKA